MTETTQDVLFDVTQKVATIKFNRPDKLNAMSAEMMAASIRFLKNAITDDRIGAIVLTGEGRAFCAGGDVSQMAKSEMTLEQKIDRLREGQEISRLLHTHPKPTIAAVNGFAMGAGLGIALSCDLRIASSAAKFGTAYAKVGFGGDYGITWGLTHLVGPAKAKELLFTADIIDAEEALRIGLVNRVIGAEKHVEETINLARRLACGPWVSFRWMKENVNLATTSSFNEILDREAITHLRCGETDDHKEGVKAFMEKRSPQFRGR